MTGYKLYSRYVADVGPIQPMQMPLAPFKGQMGAGQVNAAKFFNEKTLSVRIRYRSRSIPCQVVRQVDVGKYLIRFDEPVSAITPGQSAVFYVGNRLIGGAFISSQRGIGQYL